MAHGKQTENKSTSMVPAQEPQPLAVPQEVADFFKAEGGGASNLDQISNPFFRMSTKGSRYRIGDRDIGNMGVQFFAHIIRATPIRGYYKEKWDPAKKATPPDCASVGGIYPDPQSPDKQSEKCATCLHNRFIKCTNDDGSITRRKTCREWRRLVLLLPGYDMPVNLAIPGTSIKYYEEFLKKCSAWEGVDGGIPARYVEVEFFFNDASFPSPNMREATVVEDLTKLQKIKMAYASDAYERAERAYASEIEILDDDTPSPHAGDALAGEDEAPY